ncbi:MAG TPA: NAD(P)-dependent oxidoreductase [Candidatus Acidoferrales bacterium]|nr:NAD(P)-dependent oxidoreductase [Candidatus Acidoferrales bacterium]
MSKQRVTVLGLGIMGGGMASRLLEMKFPLTVCNRNREKAERFAKMGASCANSPREAAANADVIISMVADDDASRAMWLGDGGALAGSAAESVLVESSTLTVRWAKELSAIAAREKRDFVDAPVTGTKPHAASGELVFLAGGSAAAVEKARPVLSVLGRDVVHLGANGSGALLKLINNFLCGVQAASLAEASALISAAGLDEGKALSVLTNGAPGSPLVKSVSTRAASNDPTIYFALKLMAKDLRYAIEAGADNRLALQTALAALEIFQKAITSGHGNEDLSAVVNALKPTPAKRSA